MKKDIIVYDLDGTLSLIGDRVKHINKPVGQKNWQAFYDGAANDEVNYPIACTFACMEQFYTIKVVTGRNENQREMSHNWLFEKGLYVPHENLHMRPAGDRRSDCVVKEELIKPFQDRILLLFEDRQQVTDHWRKLGLTCAQVAPGKF